jgi:hypothetical protein
VPGPVVFGRPGLCRFFAIATFPFEVRCKLHVPSIEGHRIFILVVILVNLC